MTENQEETLTLTTQRGRDDFSIYLDGDALGNRSWYPTGRARVTLERRKKAAGNHTFDEIDVDAVVVLELKNIWNSPDVDRMLNQVYERAMSKYDKDLVLHAAHERRFSGSYNDLVVRAMAEYNTLQRAGLDGLDTYSGLYGNTQTLTPIPVRGRLLCLTYEDQRMEVQPYNTCGVIKIGMFSEQDTEKLRAFAPEYTQQGLEQARQRRFAPEDTESR